MLGLGASIVLDTGDVSHRGAGCRKIISYACDITHFECSCTTETHAAFKNI